MNILISDPTRTRWRCWHSKGRDMTAREWATYVVRRIAAGGLSDSAGWVAKTYLAHARGAVRRAGGRSPKIGGILAHEGFPGCFGCDEERSPIDCRVRRGRFEPGRLARSEKDVKLQKRRWNRMSKTWKPDEDGRWHEVL